MDNLVGFKIGNEIISSHMALLIDRKGNIEKCEYRIHRQTGNPQSSEI
jgi:hypothetical protein